MQVPIYYIHRVHIVYGGIIKFDLYLKFFVIMRNIPNIYYIIFTYYLS